MYRKYKSGRFTNNKTKSLKTNNDDKKKDVNLKKTGKMGKMTDKIYKDDYELDYYLDDEY
jgi:hypothetical protein